MDLSINLLWVTLILILGLVLTIYNACKECREGVERRMSVILYAVPDDTVQQQSINTISAAISKKLPTYDELFLTNTLPPSYEESLKNCGDSNICIIANSSSTSIITANESNIKLTNKSTNKNINSNSGNYDNLLRSDEQDVCPTPGS